MRNIPAAERDDWATFVKRERRRSGLTQQQLADAIGVARETIWRWETGRQKPEVLETVLNVADAMGADRDAALVAAELYAGEEPKSPTPDPRLRGLENDTIARHIMLLSVDEDTRTVMLNRRREILRLREKHDLEELQLMTSAEGAAVDDKKRAV